MDAAGVCRFVPIPELWRPLRELLSDVRIAVAKGSGPVHERGYSRRGGMNIAAYASDYLAEVGASMVHDVREIWDTRGPGLRVEFERQGRRHVLREYQDGLETPPELPIWSTAIRHRGHPRRTGRRIASC